MNTATKLTRLIREPGRLGPAVRRRARAANTKLRHYLPAGLNAAGAIVQVYVDDGNFSTTYSLTNFPSFFAPEAAQGCVYEVEMFDAAGLSCGTSKVDIGPFGTVEIDPKAIFARVPNLGMFAARAVAAKPFSFRYRHLGMMNSHFYAFFRHAGNGSMALIHPQTAIDQKPAPDVIWRSNHLFPTKNLECIDLFQINPSRESVQSTLLLVDRDGRELAASTATLPAHGARRLTWKLRELAAAGEPVSVAARGLTVANGKPLAFLHFNNGTFTAAHA